MENLIIVSSGWFGIEVFDLVQHINRTLRSWQGAEKYRVKGFLMTRGDDADMLRAYAPVLGTWEDYRAAEDETFALAILEPDTKKEAVERLKGRGASFATLINPTALLPLTGVTYGEGSIINPYCIKVGSRVGNFVTLWHSMAAEIDVGDYTTTLAFANITNNRIGEGTFIDHHVFLRTGCEVGAHARLEAGCMTSRSVREGAHLYGVPARKAVKNRKV